jgi:hypothetical protein
MRRTGEYTTMTAFILLAPLMTFGVVLLVASPKTWDTVSRLREVQPFKFVVDKISPPPVFNLDYCQRACTQA